MRKFVLALSAVAAVGLALPIATTTSASAETVIIKRGGHERGWHPMRHHERKVVVIKRHRNYH